ncbi:hypothetical protein DNTS_013496 [Danionella cerebrum]|uniref:ZP domain-containing protein n=1 Tax=Danionella cerebrum TaxID=2873325 RepID=A0A553RN20_9TELE|nr:hypothetical protein DNTS_013496 [Danionella translucida]
MGEALVEVVSATILYKLRWTLLTVDLSVACTMSPAQMDGSDVLWSVPLDIPPLVQLPTIEKSLKVGVGGRYLTECVAHQRGYVIHENNGTLEIRIPFRAEGGFVKSQVVDGLYSQSYSVDVFLLHEWEDAAWGLTQQRTFRNLVINHLPQPITLLDLTEPTEGEFSFSLCCFPHDVSLVNISIAGQPMLWEDMENSKIQLSHNSFPNNTYTYQFQMPFSHPLVSQKYLGKRLRRYSFSGVFSFVVSPVGETFDYPATVEVKLQDAVLPVLEGECTERGVRTLAYYGNVDSSEWSLYVGGMKLDWELVEQYGFTLEPKELHLILEVPLFAPGMAYEGLGLQGLLVSVLTSLVHVGTGEEQTHVQHCVFPVKELLVCLPDGRVVVMVDTSGISPPVNPNHTALLDPSCRPQETDQSRALYSFSIDSCGTVAKYDGNHVIYTNEVRNIFPLSPHLRPLSHLHSHYRVPIGCVHPKNGNRTIAIFLPSSIPTAGHMHKTASQSYPKQLKDGDQKLNSLPSGG